MADDWEWVVVSVREIHTWSAGIKLDIEIRHPDSTMSAWFIRDVPKIGTPPIYPGDRLSQALAKELAQKAAHAVRHRAPDLPHAHADEPHR